MEQEARLLPESWGAPADEATQDASSPFPSPWPTLPRPCLQLRTSHGDSAATLISPAVPPTRTLMFYFFVPRFTGSVFIGGPNFAGTSKPLRSHRKKKKKKEVIEGARPPLPPGSRGRSCVESGREPCSWGRARKPGNPPPCATWRAGREARRADGPTPELPFCW